MSLASTTRSHAAALTGAITAGTIFAFLVASTWDLLSVPFTVWGDAAANSLLIDRALDGRLVVGHYSRAGFNHPGPAFLYVEAGGELLFHRWLGLSSSAYGAWVLGVAALNSVLIGWTTTIAARATRSIPAALLVPLVALSVSVWAPGILANDWGPALLVVPFVLLLVSGIVLATGDYRCLTPFVVAAALLIHGHLASLTFVGAAIGGVLTLLWRQRRRDGADWSPPTRRDVLPAGLVAAMFAVPMVLHVVLDWPGELGKYWSYARSNAGRTSGTGSEVLEFVASAMFHGRLQSIVFVACVVVIGVVAAVDASRRRLARVTMAMLAGQTTLFLIYSWRTVDDLTLDYLGWFAMAIPAAAIWFGTAFVLLEIRDRFGEAWHVASAAVIAVAAVVVLADGVQLTPDHQHTPQYPLLADAVAAAPSRLSFEHDEWPTALAVLAAAVREQQHVCVIDEFWEFMVTADHICSPDDAARVVELTSPDTEPPDPGTLLAEENEHIATELVAAPRT